MVPTYVMMTPRYILYHTTILRCYYYFHANTLTWGEQPHPGLQCLHHRSMFFTPILHLMSSYFATEHVGGLSVVVKAIYTVYVCTDCIVLSWCGRSTSALTLQPYLKLAPPPPSFLRQFWELLANRMKAHWGFFCRRRELFYTDCKLWIKK